MLFVTSFASEERVAEYVAALRRVYALPIHPGLAVFVPAERMTRVDWLDGFPADKRALRVFVHGVTDAITDADCFALNLTLAAADRNRNLEVHLLTPTAVRLPPPVASPGYAERAPLHL